MAGFPGPTDREKEEGVTKGVKMVYRRTAIAAE